MKLIKKRNLGLEGFLMDLVNKLLLNFLTKKFLLYTRINI